MGHADTLKVHRLLGQTFGIEEETRLVQPAYYHDYSPTKTPKDHDANDVSRTSTVVRLRSSEAGYRASQW